MQPSPSKYPLINELSNPFNNLISGKVRVNDFRGVHPKEIKSLHIFVLLILAL